MADVSTDTTAGRYPTIQGCIELVFKGCVLGPSRLTAVSCAKARMRAGESGSPFPGPIQLTLAKRALRACDNKAFSLPGQAEPPAPQLTAY
jgi:hypothetical protein